MTPEELKSSILQMAIQGKLVEQRPEEGTGEELYQHIQAEKKRLIKSGKIRDEQPLPQILEDEKPFDIPESWVWCRITECGSFISGYTPQPYQLALTGTIPYFKVSDMNTEGNELWLSTTNSYLKDNGSSKTYFKNTIVYPKNGGALFTNKKRILSQTSVVDLNTGGYYPYAPIDFMYAYRFFSTIDFRQCYKGTALPTVDMEKLRNKIFPLPPLAEQKRIVAKIEELLPYIDRYGQALSKLEDFNKRFPGDMQKSILQMAVQGKLVEQRSEEGTGEALFQQIQAEKQRLIRAEIVKKEKPLPEITEDEKPFDIPDSWKWVRLSSLCKSIADGDHQAPPQVSNGVPFLVISNLSSGAIDFSNTRHVPQEYFNNLSPERIAEDGDLIFTVTGSYGIPVIVDCNIRFCFQRHMALLKTLIDKVYIFYLLKSPLVKTQCDYTATGTAQKTVGLNSLRNIVVPLPPLAEQKRIVAKLQEILPLCERLK